MKFSIFLIFAFFSFSLSAKECEVYGISDSPQKLNCSFKSMKVALTCRSGQYYLNSSKVTQAFHLEVEDGPVPLVFKARDMTLTAIIQAKVDIEAELTRPGRTDTGTCF